MKFKIETKTLKELVQLYESDNLNLTPPYQRNAVWTLAAQLDLIDSIRNNYPLPTFFLLKNKGDSFDMVDGQQRTRAVLKYYHTNELNESIAEDDTYKERLFENYYIPVSVITKLEKHEKIEEFYFRVNSTGLHLNRPEKIKSKYLNTNLLQLSEFILNNELLTELELFSPSAKRRMLDRDFVEELILLFYVGITDKKIAVDKLYDKDLTINEVKRIEKKIIAILEELKQFNEYYPLKATRYRQRNDFYTLVSFLKKNSKLSSEIKMYLYKVLVEISNEIRPSDNTCPIFKEYAIHCVSQSNSKDAREKRLQILEEILIGDPNSANKTQKLIMKYYGLKDSDLKNVGFITFKISSLRRSLKIKNSVD